MYLEIKGLTRQLPGKFYTRAGATCSKADYRIIIKIMYNEP